MVIFAGVDIMEATRFGTMALSYLADVTVMGSLGFEACNSNVVLASRNLT